jgi:hypothetical protein
MAGVGLLMNGQPVDPAVPFALSSTGVQLVLRMPQGETLIRATLRLAAQSAAPNGVDPARIKLASDLGGFPAGSPIRFVNATFEGEIAISSVTLTGADGFARIRTFSNTAWTPLAPIDTVVLGREQVFPPVAAQQLTAEFLLAAAGSSGQSVPIPTALGVNVVALKSTSQPCHVSLSIGDGPAFFNQPGPLPVSPVSVEGLAHVVSRWLSDHPETTDVPIIIRAAGGGSLLVTEFSAASAPARRPSTNGTDGGAGKPTTPPIPQAPPDPPASLRALLCDEGHAAAQRIGAPPPAQLLRAVALWVRAGTGSVAGHVILQPDVRDQPADVSPAATLDFALDGNAPPQWLMLTPANPLALPETSWAVCRVSTGELLWYRAPPTGGRIAPLVSVDDGAWQPAPADPGESAPGTLLAVPFWTPA